MRKSGRQIAFGIFTIGDIGNESEWLSPLGAYRFAGSGSESALLLRCLHDECDRTTVGGPSRRAGRQGPGVQWLLCGGVGVDQPDRVSRAIDHDVETLAHISDGAAIWPDLRIGDPLQCEQIVALESV